MTAPTPALTAVLAAERYDQLVKIPRAQRTPEQNARVRDLAAVLTAPPAPPARPAYVHPQWEHTTVEAAMEALDRAEKDTAADHGEEMVEAGWGDLVHSVADSCSPAVAAEFRRMQGVDAR